MRLALVRIRDADVATHWSNASVAGVPSDPMPTDPDWAQGTLYVDERSTRVDASADVLWRVIEGIGGDVGLVLVVAGVAPSAAGSIACGAVPACAAADATRATCMLGDAVDFWRVEDIVDGELLRLRAEMKLPGRAWLDLGIVSTTTPAGTLFHQRAVFAPKGLWGRAYWWSVYPFHGFVFGGMQRNIARQAEAAGRRRRPRPVAPGPSARSPLSGAHRRRHRHDRRSRGTSS